MAAKLTDSIGKLNQYFHVSSRSKQATENSANYTITYNPTFMPASGTWKLSKVEIPNVFYTINADNHHIEMFENALVKDVDIPQGVYSAAGFAAVLTAALTVATGGFAVWTATYSTATRRYTIGSTLAGTLRFLTGANAGVNNNIWHILGMSNALGTAALDVACNPAYTGLACVDFEVPFDLTIRLNINNQFINRIRFGTGFVTFSLPLLVAPEERICFGPDDLGDTVFRVPTNGDRVTPITTIAVQLLDENLRQVELYGANWDMEFEQL